MRPRRLDHRLREHPFELVEKVLQVLAVLLLFRELDGMRTRVDRVRVRQPLFDGFGFLADAGARSTGQHDLPVAEPRSHCPAGRDSAP
jgi:hypothetical protein